jgi:hypothetical protein
MSPIAQFNSEYDMAIKSVGKAIEIINCFTTSKAVSEIEFRGRCGGKV